jgi:DNA repair protein SbcD/Mre11
MKIVHTADWHLGRQFEGCSLEEDHAAALEQVFEAVTTHAADVLIIAGDVFDRAAPPEAAVRQFNGFLARVASETETAIVMIAGNHDSGDRIGAYATLSDARRALVRGPLSKDEQPLILKDGHGPVAISAIPFGYEFAARETFVNPDIKCPEDVLRVQLAAARRHIPDGARWVVVAHAFASGGDPSGCERPLSRLVGGIETVSAELFSGAHYVALGHLHREQAIGADHVRYPGAPLAFTFEEETHAKSLTLVELGADGRTTVELIPITPRRRARTLRGTLAEILAHPASDDFIRPVLTNPIRLVEPMKRIRERFPNACALTYERDLVAALRRATPASARPADNPAEVVSDFMMLVRGAAPSEAESGIVATCLAGLDATEKAAA